MLHAWLVFMNFKNDITPPLLFTLLSTYLSIGCTWWRCGCRASRPTGRWTWRWRRSTTWWPWRSWTPPPPSCCPAAPPPSPALAPGTSKQSRVPQLSHLLQMKPILSENINVKIESRSVTILTPVSRTGDVSAEDDPRTARKLILVMTGFLICWMPYFIWLPTFTLMVSNITTAPPSGRWKLQEIYILIHMQH